MAKVTGMIKTATTRLGNMLSKFEVVTKDDSQILCRGYRCDIITQETCREKPSRCCVPMMRISVLSASNFKFPVSHPVEVFMETIAELV